jgi:hypothetical protein
LDTPSTTTTFTARMNCDARSRLGGGGRGVSYMPPVQLPIWDDATMPAPPSTSHTRKTSCGMRRG